MTLNACLALLSYEPVSEKIALKWKSSIWIFWYFLLCMPMKDTQNSIKTSWNALILLRIRPMINHFPLLITSKMICKQCIQMRLPQSLAHWCVYHWVQSKRHKLWFSKKHHTLFIINVSQRSEIQFEDEDHAVYISFHWVTTTWLCWEPHPVTLCLYPVILSLPCVQ